MSFLDYCDKRAKRIGATSNQYDYWTQAQNGYKENFKRNLKVPTKALLERLEEMKYGRPMYSSDMGYERGEKVAIESILSWRNKNKTK